MNHTLKTVFVLALLLASIGCQERQAIPPEATANEVGLPIEWPPPPLTEEQIAEVRQCDLEKLASERYPETETITNTLTKYIPLSNCDWAALALAYANRRENDDSLSKSAKRAFKNAVSQNIGFALTTPLFYGYYDGVRLVKPPPFTQQAITDVRIKYHWGGLSFGDPLEPYSLEIHHANTTPTYSSTPGTIAASISPDSTEIDKGLIQALGPALSDLLPIESQFELLPCLDNFPHWTVTLTYEDGTTITLETDSNMIFFGGPWFTMIDRQNYIQFSIEFVKALAELVEALELPTGGAGAYCHYDYPVFELAYPVIGY